MAPLVSMVNIPNGKLSSTPAQAPDKSRGAILTELPDYVTAVVAGQVTVAGTSGWVMVMLPE